ncbi:MAG: MFS transporter [Phycisphaeraceae bacterium]|nr:MFS transporter [Phycisphaerales bacterium]MCB9861143.1 MFS transporter [Phycisphaeraceae bacterium]
MARLNFSREVLSAATLPFITAGIEGAIAGVFVRNAFEHVVSDDYLNALTTLVASSPALSNLSSPIWRRMLRGTDRPRIAGMLLIFIMLSVVMVSTAQISTFGAVQVVVAVIFGRILWTGFISARATTWQLNYPRESRGRITGKLATVQTLTIAALGWTLGKALDYEQNAFRVLLPVGCVIGFVTVWTWLRMPVRQNAKLRRDERAIASNADARRSLTIYQILKTDSAYRSYMMSQMMMGLGNLIMIAISPVMVKEVFHQSYSGGIAITNTLPLLMMPVSIPIWARLLDKGHVVAFRAVHSWVFVTSQTCMVLGYWFQEISLIYAAAAFQGAGFGGGVLAWPLGHMDFAPPERAADYLNVHVWLTGLRGLVAPLIAFGVYNGLKSLPESEHVPSPVSLASSGVSFLCLLLVFSGAIGFVRMWRKGEYGQKHREEQPAREARIRTGI